MKQLLVVLVLLVGLNQAQANVNLDLYDSGSVKATFCGFEPLGGEWSTNGFIDVKNDGWFSKVRLAYHGERGLAAELRTSSSGYHSLAVGPQVELKDNCGFVRLNYWAETETGKPVISIWQQHSLSKTIWTNGWLDIKDIGTLGEIQIGRRLNRRSDVVIEYRFGSARPVKELAVGCQFAL